MPGRVPLLPSQCVEYLAISGENGGFWRREVLLYLLVQLREVVVGHRGKEMVLQMVIHVQVEEPEKGVQVHSPRIETVVKDVFAETRVLGDAEENKQPGPVKRG